MVESHSLCPFFDAACDSIHVCTVRVSLLYAPTDAFFPDTFALLCDDCDVARDNGFRLTWPVRRPHLSPISFCNSESPSWLGVNLFVRFCLLGFMRPCHGEPAAFLPTADCDFRSPDWNS